MTRLVVIGAGPAGLCAAERCRELGHDDVVVLEATREVGGLARSITDEAGYTFDIGGHVMFTGYERYARLADELLGDDVTEILRQAWIWTGERTIPYPFQYNIRHLGPEAAYDCLRGLIAAQRDPQEPSNFRAWIDATFGDGIARRFMLPYNEKVWATPLEDMAFGWIAERVAVVDVDRILRSVVLAEEESPWGPNATFRYPLRGTGELWRRLAGRVADRIRLGRRVTAVDARRRQVSTTEGETFGYDHLLSTMPLDELVACCVDAPRRVREAAARLRSIGTQVVAICLDRTSDDERNWVYYPQPDVPFHRLTYLSNYSPELVPAAGSTILLTETSVDGRNPVDAGNLIAAVESGLHRVGILRRGDRVVHRWYYLAAKSYPVPTLDRDHALAAIEPWLTAHDIASRGRFGSWRYEIGNMDHAGMQGMEWVDRVLTGAEERVWSPTRLP